MPNENRGTAEWQTFVEQWAQSSYWKWGEATGWSGNEIQAFFAAVSAYEAEILTAGLKLLAGEKGEFMPLGMVYAFDAGRKSIVAPCTEQHADDDPAKRSARRITPLFVQTLRNTPLFPGLLIELPSDDPRREPLEHAVAVAIRDEYSSERAQHERDIQILNESLGECGTAITELRTQVDAAIVRATIAETECAIVRAEADRLRNILTDSEVLHANILRGDAKLTRMQALHIACATDYDEAKADAVRLRSELSLVYAIASGQIGLDGVQRPYTTVVDAVCQLRVELTGTRYRAELFEGASVHRCKECGTVWRKWGGNGGWSPFNADQKPGKCCDNAAMGEQIEEVDVAALVADLASSRASNNNRISLGNDLIRQRDEYREKDQADEIHRKLRAENESLRRENDALRERIEELTADAMHEFVARPAPEPPSSPYANPPSDLNALEFRQWLDGTPDVRNTINRHDAARAAWYEQARRVRRVSQTPEPQLRSPAELQQRNAFLHGQIRQRDGWLIDLLHRRFGAEVLDLTQSAEFQVERAIINLQAERDRYRAQLADIEDLCSWLDEGKPVAERVRYLVNSGREKDQQEIADLRAKLAKAVGALQAAAEDVRDMAKEVSDVSR